MSDPAPEATLQGRRILLVIGGGIAAYKTLELIRLLRARGATVCAILTRAGAEFVTPLSVATLTGSQVFTDLFDLKDETEIGHIQLSRQADLIVVAPATADLMARMVHGLASDLASTVLLATDTPVLAAPAMNVRMWQHPATQRNLSTLKGDGIRLVGPNAGDMACGEYGPGRMAEPGDIVAEIVAVLHAGGGPLAGKHVLVTSGPTHEPIDPVRYLANRSSGKQGHAIAQAAARLGARVTLVSGPTAEPAPPGVTMVRVETARAMLEAAQSALPADIAVCAAAVADWRTREEAAQKLKKALAADAPSLELVANPDILATLSQPGAARPALVIGFAAETENVIGNATAKREKKGCDWMVANDVSATSGVMGGERNTVHLVTSGGVESWPEMAKADVATRLMQRAADTAKQMPRAAE